MTRARDTYKVYVIAHACVCTSHMLQVWLPNLNELTHLEIGIMEPAADCRDHSRTHSGWRVGQISVRMAADEDCAIFMLGGEVPFFEAHAAASGRRLEPFRGHTCVIRTVTGDLRGASTSAHANVVLTPSGGGAPIEVALNRSDQPRMFRRAQTDSFELEVPHFEQVCVYMYISPVGYSAITSIYE